MHTQDLIIEQRQGVAYLILNRPSALNALNLNMVRAMHQALKHWEHDDRVQVVVVKGAGEKAFCAGGDIRTLYEGIKSGEDAHMTFFKEEFALNEYIYGYPKPYIAIMDGYVMGGGMGISQGASHRVVTERTKLSMPETAIGYFPDVGASYFLSRCPGALGVYLGVTGQSITGADAVYANLADSLLPATDLTGLYARLESLEQGLQMQRIRVQVQEILADMQSPLHTHKDGLESIAADIESCFSQATIQDIEAAVQACATRAPAHWLDEAQKRLKKHSPLALRVALDLIRRGRTLSLSECFALELRLVAQWMLEGDFLEGVRALIIDKDNSPHWRYTREALTPERMQVLLPALYMHH